MKPLETFLAAKQIPGAISMTEAVGIYDTVVKHFKAWGGIAADFGSHAGKSSIIGAKALSDAGFTDTFYMVDLAYDLDNTAWENTVQGSSERMPWGYLRGANDLIQQRMLEHYLMVELRGLSSLQFLSRNIQSLAYVFIDSDDHQFDLVMAEVKMLEDIVSPGGLVFFHDFENQYIAPKQAHDYLIGTEKYENIPIDWDAAKAYAEENKLEEGNVSWHMSGSGIEFPNFIGCVRAL